MTDPTACVACDEPGVELYLPCLHQLCETCYQAEIEDGDIHESRECFRCKLSWSIDQVVDRRTKSIHEDLPHISISECNEIRKDLRNALCCLDEIKNLLVKMVPDLSDRSEEKEFEICLDTFETLLQVGETYTKMTGKDFSQKQVVAQQAKSLLNRIRVNNLWPKRDVFGFCPFPWIAREFKLQRDRLFNSSDPIFRHRKSYDGSYYSKVYFDWNSEQFVTVVQTESKEITVTLHNLRTFQSIKDWTYPNNMRSLDKVRLFSDAIVIYSRYFGERRIPLTDDNFEEYQKEKTMILIPNNRVVYLEGDMIICRNLINRNQIWFHKIGHYSAETHPLWRSGLYIHLQTTNILYTWNLEGILIRSIEAPNNYVIRWFPELNHCWTYYFAQFRETGRLIKWIYKHEWVKEVEYSVNEEVDISITPSQHLIVNTNWGYAIY